MKSTILFLVFLNICATLASEESPVTCASEGEACVIHEDSLLDTFGGVTTVEECRQLCQDTEGCEYLTYFNASGDLFREVCYTFSSCEETYSCQNCASETQWCYAVCGKRFYGVIGNNLIDVAGDVDSESDCKDICKSTDTCTYYTYFTEDDLHSKACVLLSSLMGPFQNCDTCLTGAVDCKGFGDCSLQYNGESHRSLMFTKPGLDINVTTPPFTSSECQLRVLAIGGGGKGNSGGGGSGYIQFYSETFTAETFISLTVGDWRQSSSVTVNDQTVMAAPGNDAGVAGADGYSGGGGYINNSNRGCDGGTDGSDGEDCSYDGGHGTGDDVTAYKMKNFVLTPGAGGKCYNRYGGGGGGVMVNGEGPQRESDNQGEGYGGGGALHSRGGISVYDGLPGVILMEVEEH